MKTGTIKMLNHEKGFGFLRTPDGDVFFHRSVVKGNPFELLEIGQPAGYDLGESKTDKGPRASLVDASPR